MVRGKATLLAWTAVLPLILFGCATSDNPAPPVADFSSLDHPRTVADPRTPSSLEAMQRGVASVTPPGSPLKDIFFQFDNYDLNETAREILKTNADWLKSDPSSRVEIEGHCDDLGTSEYNLALGFKRAQSAKDFLATLGISADRLSVISYGKEAPACMEQTEECREKNRRDRFVIVTILPTS